MADSRTLIDTTPPARAGLTPDGWAGDSWYLGCASGELEANGLLHRVMLDQPILIGRTEAGEAFALRDVCPHRLVPLSEGRMLDTSGEPTVECPYHGWRFGIDGICRLLPSVLESQNYEAERFRVRRYPVAEKNGLVFVFIADDPRIEGEPDMPAPAVAGLSGAPKAVVETILDLTMAAAMAKLMDPARPASAWSGGWEADEHRAGEPYQATPQSLACKAVFGNRLTVKQVFQPPASRWEIARSGGKVQIISLSCLTPVYPGQTRLTHVVWAQGSPLLAAPLIRAAARRFVRKQIAVAGPG